MRAFFLSVLVCLSVQGQLATMPGGGTMWTIGSGVSAPDILWWKGDPGTGTTQTGTVGPDGTLSNSGAWGTTFTPGGSTTDWVFGLNSGYHINSASDITYSTNKVTVEFRIYLASTGNTVAIQWYVVSVAMNAATPSFGIYNDLDSGTGKFICKMFANGFNAGTFSFARCSAATWHHYAIVFDDSAAVQPTVYLDGNTTPVSVTTISDTRAAFSNYTTAGLAINSTDAGFGNFWSAVEMKDVRIYSGARSSADVSVDATSYP